MHTPATHSDALEVVRKSGLIPEERLSSYLERLRTEWPLDPQPAELFDDMVQQGLLTAFQASHLGKGRYSGFQVGNYRILDRLGQGGSGQVFLAEHTKLGNRVALKVLSRHTASPLALQRFLREARAAAKLRHPNIIRVDDVNPTHDPPYIVMEYADGITLQAAVSRYGTSAAGDAACIGHQIALGLQEAHRNGLVHRDVKPANVLVDRRGVARLLDLGIVRIDGENLTGEYAKQVILGTIDYLSPEQAIDSSNVDTRADIYSLGATLYFLFTGTSPVPAGPLRERLAKLQSADPPHLRLLRSDLPRGLADVVHRMLAKAPADRYATPADAAEALAPYAHPGHDFPAKLFRHLHATVSDTDGALTPPGGTPFQETDLPDSPTAAHPVEIFHRPQEWLPPRQLLSQSPHVRSWKSQLGWILAVMVVVFGMLGIAYYVNR